MRNCAAVGLTLLLCFLGQCEAEDPTEFKSLYISFENLKIFTIYIDTSVIGDSANVKEITVVKMIGNDETDIFDVIKDPVELLASSYEITSKLAISNDGDVVQFVMRIVVEDDTVFRTNFQAKVTVFESNKLTGNYLTETSSFFLTYSDITLDASFGVTDSETGEHNPCITLDPEDPKTKCTGSVTNPPTNELIICTKTDTTNIPTCSTSTLSNADCDTDSELEVTFELNNNAGPGNKFKYTDQPPGIAIINTATCWDMTAGCVYEENIVADETITILNQVETDQCTKHDFTVLDMDIVLVFDTALEISWTIAIDLAEKQFYLSLTPEDVTNKNFPEKIHIDCADIGNGKTCYAYAFEYDQAKPVILVLSSAIEDPQGDYDHGIMKTEETVPAGGPTRGIGENQKSSLLKLLNLDIDWESSTNHLCLQDPTLSSMNESLYNYELVWATADGKWKKYTHYEIKNTHVCFDGINIDQEEIESSPRVKILALKRDKNNKKVVGSDLVVADLTKPVVTPVTDHVIKVELGGVQHGFVIRDVATNHIITRDLGDMGAPTFLTTNKDNGGVYNKHFILEMNNDGMKTRVHFFTPHITAAATRFQRHPVKTESQ